MEYGIFGNLMEYNPFRFLRFQFQHFEQVPCDSLSLAVLIGSQPNHIRFVCLLFQRFHQLFFVGRDFINRFIVMLDIHTEILFFFFFFMSVARKDFKILSQKLLNGFSLCRRLYDYQIFCHMRNVRSNFAQN